MPVNKEGKSREAEEGSMGIIAHPDFAKNHWIFMLYADPDEPKHVLARWEYDGDTINETYTIPEGNLFPKETPKTRPEIYTMGHRNPWRISIDSQTG